MAEQEEGNIRQEYNAANTGLNMDRSVTQIPKGQLTYALNAAVENFDSNSVNYQNEPGNELCLTFPEGYLLIGEHFIPEKSKHIFFLVNPEIGGSEIGYMDNNDCVYRTYVNAPCLNFNINNPIHKAVHRITECTTEVYWTDGLNPRRYIDLNPENLPYVLIGGTPACDPIYSNEIDCNGLNVQPNFTVPQLEVTKITTGGDLTAGTYQFAIQYSDANGNPFTSYYSVTNPTPIADTGLTTPNFNYQVGKSIELTVSNLEGSGLYQYFNIAVIKTINGVTSVELIGTYFIDDLTQTITYTGQIKTDIRLTINDIFEKFPYYEIAQDITAVRDILVWDQLTSIERINYQQIATGITLQWETHRIPNTETYADAFNATNLRGYLRDEVYAFEIVFLLKNGKQTDGFHIPGRLANANDLFPVSTANDDFIGEPEDPIAGTSPYWKIYNTATVTGFSPGYSPATNYKGPYQYGEFSYWESTEEYPCNEELWGSLAGQKIRHHKFPDVLVSPIFESALFTGQDNMVMQKDAVFPLGVRIDVQQVQALIQASNLTAEQKSEIAGFKIIRGDRSTNRSIVAKGILRNVGKYDREGTEYYFPNYPYNDLRQDPFLLEKSNSYTIPLAATSNTSICRKFSIYPKDPGEIEYIDCYTSEIVKKKIGNNPGDDFPLNTISYICALDYPKPKYIGTGVCAIGSNTYNVYRITINKFSSLSPTVVFRLVWPITRCGLSNGNTIPPPVGYSMPSGNVDGWTKYCAENPTTSCCDLFLNKPLDINNQYAQLVPTGVGDFTFEIASLTPPTFDQSTAGDATTVKVEYVRSVGTDLCNPDNLQGFDEEGAKYRHVLNSPETSFGQPFLGGVLKLENVIYGAGKAHFVEVKKNAMYRLLSAEAQQDALNSANRIASITTDYNATALFAAYQAYLTIYVNGITRRNYSYSYNSIASYDYSNVINNGLGIKQRELELKQYLIPGVQGVGDNKNVNNWNRESSVYLKTKENYTGGPRSPLPFPNQTPTIGGLVNDRSRMILSEAGVNENQNNCGTPAKEEYISVISYYGSLKNIFVNQYGQIYSYDTVDTGFQRDITPLTGPVVATFFGGDTFISKFAFKTKLPFFIDNRVNAPDDSDIFYDEIGNVAYPVYWHSGRSILTTAAVDQQTLTNFISIKANNLDCPNSQTPITSPGRTYYDGKMYQFAYGIPYFYCESSYNVDLRQAFNNREGDFWPHVSTGIPDDWVQEDYVPIAQDNTYYYNVTFSKQNRENTFTHLPYDWKSICYTNFSFRAIYSDSQELATSPTVNNWLIYRANSFFDFPQNFGPLVSLDGIQNKAILARFENKSLLYNTLLTINTSNPQAAYVGNPTLFTSAPPIDFAETDLGYVGSQNKMLLKIPQGQITVDAKRGQVFLVAGNQVQDLSAFGSGMNRFFTDHLAFEILRYYPKVDIDNHFNGVGLHGVYDSKFDRIILTKLDYIPNLDNIVYDDVNQKFYLEQPVECCDGEEFIRKEVFLTDSEYFCNKSWTLSFNFNTGSWISFHSYIPNWYIAENNFFYSGLNDCCADFDAVVGNPVPNTTTTTTTQFVCECNTYDVTNASEDTLYYDYVDCNNQPQNSTPIAGGTTQTVCVCGDQIYAAAKGLDVTLVGSGCLTTTTTTTAFQGCGIEGVACEITTTTTTSTSTTTTTTTAFPCECYVVYNSTETTHLVASYKCGADSISYTPVEAGQLINLCVSTEMVPYSDEGVIITLCGTPCTQDSDCEECTTTTTTTLAPSCDDCYEYTVTSELGATFQWIDCQGFTQTDSVGIDQTYNIPCAVQNSVLFIFGFGTATIGAYCGNTCGTTTTTTLPPL
jgi:hypothetical protein